MKAWKVVVIFSIFILLIGILLTNDKVCDYFLPTIPQYQLSDKWGFRNLYDTEIKSIIIKVPDQILTNLKDRIKNRISSFSFENSNFKYGFNVKYLNTLMDYWANTYQWRHWESEINKLPHYFTNIKGLQIHFIHIKPVAKPEKTSIPILLLHGWPGSFFEFYKLIPMLSSLTEKESFDFEIICPSLVGYGWSDSPQKGDFTFMDMSDIMIELMKRLNITQKFYIQGGDYGSIIGGIMAQLYPEKIAGIHVNFPMIELSDLRVLAKLFVGSVLPSKFHFLTEKEINMIYPFGKRVRSLMDQLGYYWFHATRPSTIGVALSDSPAGLAAYIMEKFGSWSNNLSYHLNSPNGGIENLKISKDEMLTNVMIYYITNSISTSIMLYRQLINEYTLVLNRNPILVPTGISSFPNEILQLPKVFAHNKYRDIRQFTYMPSGGHFAALEEPELLANDMISFIKLVEHVKPINA